VYRYRGGGPSHPTPPSPTFLGRSTTTQKLFFGFISFAKTNTTQLLRWTLLCRALRELLFTAPGFEKFCSGVIMFEETLVGLYKLTHAADP
jgi:fructose-bisphosphate aldolase class 1